ncbi:DUF1800 family protein [Cucumibacter marinus]|uniref:DUF1800 family protein n=1 Tax=Cucumibacter marinus TaxID=1121252 RepID=UPI00041A875A|nr:DUF1800 family protein [Cucumibacter marinus]
MSTSRAARRLGLGFRPSAGTDLAESDWVDAQLVGEFTAPGYARFDGRNTEIGEWPEALTYSLSDRMDRHKTRVRTILDAEAKQLDSATLARIRADAWNDYTVHAQDIHRLAHRGLYGEDQFRQRLTWFWANHFTVGRKGDENIEFIGHYVDTAIGGALDGSFADMVYGVVTHPAMGIYLDNVYNVGENSQVARICRRDGCQAGPNDNLGRELMELHTVSPSRGYTEDDIRNAANILSGWGYPPHPNDRPPFTPDDWWQSAFFKQRAQPGGKTVLGRDYPEGPAALRRLVDDLSIDASTADFLSRKLVLHFIGEAATEDDVAAVREAWTASDGHLPTVHRAVAERTLEPAAAGKFVWPIIWLFQAMRISGADFFYGYEQLNPMEEVVQRRPERVFEELGFDFWSVRQPDGYSDRSEAWISTEHFDRRIRFADLIYRFGNPRLSAAEIADALGLSAKTRDMIATGNTPRDRFVLCLCSKEFMEV